MISFEEYVKGISSEELIGGPCLFCIAYQIPLISSFHLELHGGPITPDEKCEHCYDIEVEFGRLKLTEEEKRFANQVMVYLERLNHT